MKKIILLVIILIILTVLISASLYWKYGDLSTIKPVGTSQQTDDIAGSIATFYPKKTVPNVYVVTADYGTLQPTITDNLYRAHENITFKLPLDATKISAPGENRLFYFGDDKFINIDTYSVSTRYSVDAYLSSGLEKDFAAADGVVLNSENIKSNYDFVNYILNLNPEEILEETGDKRGADYRLLLVKAGLFPRDIQDNKVFRFSSDNLKGFVFDPKSSADNIKITVFTNDGNIYNIIFHSKERFSKTEIDTFLSSLEM